MLTNSNRFIAYDIRRTDENFVQHIKSERWFRSTSIIFMSDLNEMESNTFTKFGRVLSSMNEDISKTTLDDRI